MSFAATVPRVAVPRHSYNPLEVQRPCIRSLLLLHLEKCQLRPWECGNSEGISKECGKGGKPDSWLSTLSILCHFHGLLWKRASHNHNHRKGPVLGTVLLVRTASISDSEDLPLVRAKLSGWLIDTGSQHVFPPAIRRARLAWGRFWSPVLRVATRRRWSLQKRRRLRWR